MLFETSGSEIAVPIDGDGYGFVAGPIQIRSEPIVPSRRVVKLLLDRCLALLLLFIFAPLLVVIAVAIKLDTPGPMLFRQRRAGLNGRPFTILKFRSMSVACNDLEQARRGDRRVTRIGALLRRSSLDELPQLLNVLRGEMSLVGPRPHALPHDALCRAQVSRYPLRQALMPGMTGWAQINGARGETASRAAMQARVDLDLWYQAHWSLGLDLHILWRTCLELCRLDAY